MSNYMRRESGGNNNKDHDILGIVLMIISAFLLLCCAVPVIFGPVSSAIQAFFLGVFGIFAYALFAFVFAIGLVLVLRRKIDVSAKKALAIAGIAVFLMLLLQLITTNSHLSENIGEYLSAVYGAKWTAGGVIFGVVAYGIKALISTVGAYIVISLLLVGCIALLTYIILRERGISLSRNKSRKARRAVPERSAQPSLITEEEPLAQRVSRHNGVTSLFIEDVAPGSDGGSGPEGFGDEVHGGLYDDEVDYGRLDLIGKRRITQTQASNILYRPSPSDWEEFDPILSSMKKPDKDRDRDRSAGTENESSRPAPGGDYYSGAAAQGESRTSEAAPDVHKASVEDRKKPDKILHGSDRMGNGLTDLTLPTPKTPEAGYETGSIINTSTLEGYTTPASSSFTDFSRERQFTGYTRGSEADTAYGFGRTEERSAGPETNDDRVSDRNDSAIVSADHLADIHDLHTEHTEPEHEPARSTAETRKTGYEPYGGSGPETFGASGRNVADNDSPIASEGWLDRVSSEEEAPEEEVPVEQRPFYQTAEAVPEEGFDSFASAPTITTQTDFDKHMADDIPGSGSEAVAEEKSSPDAAAYRPAPAEPDRDPTLSVSEEVTDLSEAPSFEGEDHTGYYIRDDKTPPSPQPRPAPERPAPVREEPVREEKPAPAPEPAPEEPYVYDRPPMDLLGMPEEDSVVDSADIENKTHAIEEILSSLKFPAKVCNVIVGPSVTRYELQPPQGIPVKRILSLDMDLELTLASGAIRIEAPVANKQVVGIEVANSHPVSVAFREIIDSPAFRDSRGMLPLALGKDIGGDAIVRNLEKMPHLLVAGATNMGKSVCLNTIIVSLIYRSSPEDVRIVLVDPKQIEFTLYRGLPHLLLENPITDVNHAINALNYLIDEMERRFELFNNMSQAGYAVRNLEEYNKCDLVRSGKAKKIPYIVMVVDELADLMTTKKKEVEGGIRRIAQKARAAGIHLVLATQRPSVDIITGSIKVNLPSRISLKVTSNADSRTVLDQGGAESLIGRGDMLLMCNSEPIRLQGAFLTNEEIVSIVNYVKSHNKAIFDKDIEKVILVDQNEPEENASAASESEESADEKMFPNIMRCFINCGKASTSLIQTRFSLGYARAARIINTLEMRRWVGPSTGAKPREVYMTESQFETIFGIPFNE